MQQAVGEERTAEKLPLDRHVRALHGCKHMRSCPHGGRREAGRHPLIQDRTIAAGVANLTHPSAGALYSTSSIQDCAQLLRLLSECTSLSSSDSSELCMEPSMSSKSLSNSRSFFFAAMICSRRPVQGRQSVVSNLSGRPLMTCSWRPAERELGSGGSGSCACLLNIVSMALFAWPSLTPRMDGHALMAMHWLWTLLHAGIGAIAV